MPQLSRKTFDWADDHHSLATNAETSFLTDGNTSNMVG